MDQDLATSSVFADDRMIILAREIAMDIHPLETILEHNKVGQAEWDRLSKNPRFAQYLTDAISTWQSALNAPERIKVKSLAAIEDWLLTAYGLLHEKDGSLRDKTELAKLVARLAGVGETVKGELPAGEKVTINITMGGETVHSEKLVSGVSIEHEDKL